MAAIPNVGARTASFAAPAQVPIPSNTYSQRHAVTLRAAQPIRQAAGTNNANLEPAQALAGLVGAPHNNPHYEAVRLTAPRLNQLVLWENPPTAINPNAGVINRIRDFLVDAMATGTSIIVNASGFTEEEVALLTESTPTHFFSVFIYFAVRQWRSVDNPAGGEPLRELFRCNVYAAYGSGDTIVATIRDNEDHYGASRLAVSKMIVTKKLRPQGTARTIGNATRVAYSAAGFSEIICDAVDVPGPIPLFFPSTYGNDCFLQIMEHIFSSLVPSPVRLQEIWLQDMLNFLKLRLRTGGITTNTITALNRHLALNPLRTSIGFIAIQIHKHTYSSNRLRPPTANTLSVAPQPGSLLRIFHITSINFAGELATAANQGDGGLHYIWVKDMPAPFTTASKELIEQSCALVIENHRQSVISDELLPDSVTRVNYEKLHSVNVKQMKFASDRDALVKSAREASREEIARKRSRSADSSEGESALAQQAQCDSASAWVACYDIESKFSKAPTSELPRDLVEGGYIEGDVCIHHPFLIHFGLFKLFANSAGRNLPFSKTTSQDDIDDIIDHHNFDLFYVRDESPLAENNFVINTFLATLAQECKLRNVKQIYLLAHNGSKYDHQLLFNFCKKDERCSIENILITPRGILGATFIYDGVRIDLRCTALQLPKSLAELCVDLDVPKLMWKKEFEFTSDFTHEFYEAMSAEDKARLTNYAKYDIYSMFFIILRLEELLQKLDPIRPCDVDFESVQKFKPQCSKMTFQSFIRGVLMKQFFDSPFPPPRVILFDDLLLSSLRGGMTQTFAIFFQSPLHDFLKRVPEPDRPRAYKFALHHAATCAKLRRSISLADPDRNSLYPYTMLSRGVPKGPAYLLKWGVFEFCQEFIFDRRMCESQAWGVVLVKIFNGTDGNNIRSCHFPLLSYRTQNGSSMLYTNSAFDNLTPELKDKLDEYRQSFVEENGYMWVTSDHLAIYHSAGLGLDCKVGFFWSPQFNNWSTEYQPFIKEMYEERQKNRANNTVQQIYKLGMNGAFGSSGQKATTTTHIISTKDLPPKYLVTNKLRDTLEIADGQFRVYHLEAKPGCVSRDLSCKSTVTNTILSGSLRTMLETQFEIQKLNPQHSVNDIFDLTFYMDTDSNYCLAEYCTMLEEAGKIGKDIGQFSTEAGECITYFVAPAAKQYCYQYLTPDGIKTSGKCKGLPLYKTSVSRETGKIDKEENIDIVEAFEKLITTGELSADKTVWNKSIGHGVTTADSKYTVEGEAFITKSNKIGWHTQITAGGCVVQRWVPVGFVPPPGQSEGSLPRRYFSDFDGNVATILWNMEQDRLLALNHYQYCNAVDEMEELFKYWQE